MFLFNWSSALALFDLQTLNTTEEISGSPAQEMFLYEQSFL
jgi:hypothetical protein